jgi:hypothetical protein
MLFSNIETFRTYADSNSGIRLAAIKNSIDHATSKYIVPAIGSTYYEYLLTQLDATPSAEESKLIDKLRKALASLTLYEYSFITEVQLSDKGLRRGHEESLPGAFKYQVQEYRKSVIERGFMQLDEALEYLEKMAKDSDAVTWVDSDHFQEYTELFIKNGSDFRKVMSQILFPRRFYTLLRSNILSIQRLTIRNLITSPLYAVLLEKNQESDPDFTAEEKELLFMLKSAIAHMAISKGASSIISAMDENGIHLLSNSSESSNAAGKRTASGVSLLNHLIDGHEASAKDWMDAAVQYLDEVASDSVFPEWFTYKQSLLQQPETTSNNYAGAFGM